MANYSYLHLKKPISTARFRRILREAVLDWFGSLMTVNRGFRTTYTDGTYTRMWIVSAPGTAVSDRAEANKLMMPLDDDFGFLVELQDNDTVIAFRSSIDWKTRWASGCVSELLSERLGIGLFFDATDRTYPPGLRYDRDGGPANLVHRFWKAAPDLARALGTKPGWVRERWPWTRNTRQR